MLRRGFLRVRVCSTGLAVRIALPSIYSNIYSSTNPERKDAYSTTVYTHFGIERHYNILIAPPKENKYMPRLCTACNLATSA